MPEFEPQLKAGANFSTRLEVPEWVRESAGTGGIHRGNGVQGDQDGDREKSVSWVVEVSSQVIFSNSAAVHYEILLGRDEKSLSLGFVSGLNSNIVGGSSTGQGMRRPVTSLIISRVLGQGRGSITHSRKACLARRSG